MIAMLDKLVRQLKKKDNPYCEILVCDYDCSNCDPYLQIMSCDECELCKEVNENCRDCKTLRLEEWHRKKTLRIESKNG